MTGYLQNLVHRVVDDSRHLRPRLPSHFEPVDSRVAAADTDELEDTLESRPQRGQEVDEPRSSSRQKDALPGPSVSEDRFVSTQSKSLRDSSTSPKVAIETHGVDQLRADVNGFNNRSEATASIEHRLHTERGASYPTRVEISPRSPRSQPQNIAVLAPFSTAIRTPAGSKSPLPITASRHSETELDGSRTGPDEEEIKTRSRPQIASHRPQTGPLQTHLGDYAADDVSTQSEKRLYSAAVIHDSAQPTPSLDLKSMSERDANIRLLVAELRNSSTERRTESAVLQPGGLQPAMPQPQPQQMRLMDNDARAPQQTINVTIGRIEIRAVAANDTPRSIRRERPAVMSLDEYLSQNAMGGSK